MHATVSKLKIYEGDPVFDRLMAEFDASQEEGAQLIELSTHLLDAESRMDFMAAVLSMGYDCGYSQEEEILEIWLE